MPVADDIRRWSSELAGDPQSLVFADLADALLQQGDLDAAERLASRGVERHPAHAAGFSVLARVAEARGDIARASHFWERARAAAPAPVPSRVPDAMPSFRNGNGHAHAPAPASRAEVTRSLVADADGLLLASPQPTDDLYVLESMAAAVAGVGEDADRATMHLGLGQWRALVLETSGDALAIAPAGSGALTVLSVAQHVPIGRVRALLRVASARVTADGF
jgi:predicted regulator of Ras-like GTPase activity (Roadblock/LC7/MglB family)